MPSIVTEEVFAMHKNKSLVLPDDPDVLVFWLTTSLCALFLLFSPGVIPA